MKGRAMFEGKQIELHNRVAFHQGAIYYDLSDDRWRAVRVDENGWSIIERPPILFYRYSHQQPQLEPIKGGDPKKFLGFANVTDPQSQLLLLVTLVVSFIPDIARVIIVPYGEKGSGKTCLHKLLKKVIDPSLVHTMSLPRNIDEMVQKLNHHYFPVFDNITYIPDWIIDCLCRATSGEGFSKRQLYTDSEDVIFSFKRMIGVNGISVISSRSDFLDRCLLIRLNRIPPESRREERKLWDNFNHQLPHILGGVFDTLSSAMRIYPEIQVKYLPRMADWCRWGCAVAEAIGHDSNKFYAAYMGTLRRQTEEVLNASVVGAALMALMTQQDYWQGRCSDLLKDLESVCEKEKINIKQRSWPKKPHTLTRRIEEIESNLADIGIKVTRDRTMTMRLLTITKHDANDATAKSGVMLSEGNFVSKMTPYDANDANDATSPSVGLGVKKGEEVDTTVLHDTEKENSSSYPKNKQGSVIGVIASSKANLASNFEEIHDASHDASKSSSVMEELKQLEKELDKFLEEHGNE